MNDYMPKAIDPRAMEEALAVEGRFQDRLLDLKIAEAKAYHNGYTDCLHQVGIMLHSSNYEKREAQDGT